jgi:hypothetical protein
LRESVAWIDGGNNWVSCISEEEDDDVKDGDAASIRHYAAVFALETWELGVSILIEQHKSLWQPLQM